MLKEEVLKEEVLKEEVLKEEVLKEEVLKEEVLKEEVLKEEVLKEEVLKEEVFEKEEWACKIKSQPHRTTGTVLELVSAFATISMPTTETWDMESFFAQGHN